MKTTDSLSPCLMLAIKYSRSTVSEICSFFIWIITSPMSTPTLSAIEPVPYPTHIGTKDDRYAFPTCFANIGDSRSELGAGDCLRLSDELFKSWLVKTQDCMPIKHGHVNIVLPGKSHGLFGGKRVGANIMVLVGYSFARKKLFQRLTMGSGRAGIDINLHYYLLWPKE